MRYQPKPFEVQEYSDPEHALRALSRKISDAIWGLDTNRAQLRWAQADHLSNVAQQAAQARLNEAEDRISYLAKELGLDTRIKII
jgi:uncharacterized protein YifN (PemK superfamily)